MKGDYQFKGKDYAATFRPGAVMIDPESREFDPLNIIKGIINGFVFGCCCWSFIFFVAAVLIILLWRPG